MSGIGTLKAGAPARAKTGGRRWLNAGFAAQIVWL